MAKWEVGDRVAVQIAPEMVGEITAVEIEGMKEGWVLFKRDETEDEVFEPFPFHADSFVSEP